MGILGGKDVPIYVRFWLLLKVEEGLWVRVSLWFADLVPKRSCNKNYILVQTRISQPFLGFFPFLVYTKQLP